MSGTLTRKAKETKCICAKYVGIIEQNGETKHLVFVHHVIKGETHIYDSMQVFNGQPKCEYKQYDVLTEGVDFSVVYTDKGFPKSFNFK